MIELNVADYCDHCPEFEPVVDTIYRYSSTPECQTVTCEHRDRCALIYNRMMFQLKKDKEKTDA